MKLLIASLAGITAALSVASMSVLYTTPSGLPEAPWHNEIMNHSSIPPATDSKAWVWAKYPISGPDPSYTASTKKIDSMSPHDLQAFRDECDNELAKNQSDDLTKYNWAYSSWKCMSHRMPSSIRKQTVYIVGCELQETSAPYDYNFARIRFLYDSDFTQNRYLLPLGDSLLAENPNDVDVEVGMISVLEAQYDTDPNVAARQRLANLADKITSDNPDQLLVHTIRGSAFETFWSDDKNDSSKKNDALLAENEYLEYLRLAPSDDWYRARAQWWINWLQKYTQ